MSCKSESHRNVMVREGALSAVGAVNFATMATSEFQTKDFGPGTKNNIHYIQGVLTGALILSIFLMVVERRGKLKERLIFF